MDVSSIVYSDENNCYFIVDDILYYANKNELVKIMQYSEWKYNSNNIFIFNNNN